MKIPIADLHCDLLSYIALDNTKNVNDSASRCSLPQLQEGNVQFQTLAVFSETKADSVQWAEKQIEAFCSLSQGFDRVNHLHPLKVTHKVQVALAIENASCLCIEEEPLEACFNRLERLCTHAGPIVYISLTWNQENRFGGGNLSQKGLKPDGEQLLHFLDGKKIAIDLSHTSDALAEDILNYIDKKSLKLLPLASHSNFRSVCRQLRNLPDFVAKEIVKRGGVIGINLFRHFLGESVRDISRHVEHALYLGALDHYCFGADFFYEQISLHSLYPRPYFHDELSNSGCYPHLLSHLKSLCGQKEIENIAFGNARAFFERLCG